MAEPIRFIADLHIPQTAYTKLRPQIRSGDLLFCSGDFFTSKVVQKITDSPWSHVAIVLKLDAYDRILVLESLEVYGVRLAPLSSYLSYDGTLVLARHTQASHRLVEGAVTFGLDQLTQRYNYLDCVAILTRAYCGVGRSHPKQGFLCSELVASCFETAGCHFAYPTGEVITPGIIWADPLVQPLARLVA